MGDPKKLSKKYTPLAHPWIRSAIDENKELKKEYGLTKRKEILIASSFLKKYKDIAKKLIANHTPQGEKEKAQMMDKLQRYGLLQPGAGLDEILSIKLKDILERRLQSITFRKGMARTMTQSRQFIVHRHIMVGNKEITSPSYMLTLEEEAKLMFKPTSTLSKADHPERVILVKDPAKEAKKENIRKDRQEKSRFGSGRQSRGRERRMPGQNQNKRPSRTEDKK